MRGSGGLVECFVRLAESSLGGTRRLARTKGRAAMYSVVDVLRGHRATPERKHMRYRFTDNHPFMSAV